MQSITSSFTAPSRNRQIIPASARIHPPLHSIELNNRSAGMGLLSAHRALSMRPVGAVSAHARHINTPPGNLWLSGISSPRGLARGRNLPATRVRRTDYISLSRAQLALGIANANVEVIALEARHVHAMQAFLDRQVPGCKRGSPEVITRHVEEEHMPAFIEMASAHLRALTDKKIEVILAAASGDASKTRAAREAMHTLVSVRDARLADADYSKRQLSAAATAAWHRWLPPYLQQIGR